MAKPPEESYLEYKRRVIDPISRSFCAAKWLNATMWLDRGWTTSCHLPPHHQVGQRAVAMNPSALHNTPHKKKMRELMLKGERPKECDYCWRIEDMKRDAVSDRVFKTVIYSDEDIRRIAKMPASEDVALRTLEISFDRVCNFACSYCNSGFSTTWAQDIKKHGPYRLHSEGSDTFKVDGSYGEIEAEGNPYIAGFWKWWPELSQSLQELRISGGEPLMSNEVWRIFDEFKTRGLEHMHLAVNSNLGAKDSLIERLTRASHDVKHLSIYTSNESYGAHAEYIRDGLKYDRWRANIHKLMREGRFKAIHVMMTINALSLYSITELFDDILSWRAELGAGAGKWSLNLLRFPSFMSPLILPDEMKLERAAHLRSWLERERKHPHLSEMEIAGVERLIHYLTDVKSPHARVSSLDLQRSDFRSFYQQYDQRRGKDFHTTFAGPLSEWVKTIEIREEPGWNRVKQRAWPLYAWYYSLKDAVAKY